jgi:hypothetical protein
MRKRRWLLLALLTNGLLGTSGVLFVRSTLPRHHYLGEERFLKIQFGMTEVAIQEILGMPAGDYTTGPTQQHGRVRYTREDGHALFAVEKVTFPDLSAFQAPGGAGFRRWDTDRASIMIDLGEDGKAAALLFRQMEPAGEKWSLLDRLRRWLHL